jgi:hypothetical protein
MAVFVGRSDENIGWKGYFEDVEYDHANKNRCR